MALSQSKNVGCVVTIVVQVSRESANEIKVLRIEWLQNCETTAKKTSFISQLLLQDDLTKVIFDCLRYCHDKRIAKDLVKIKEYSTTNNIQFSTLPNHLSNESPKHEK